MTELLQEIRRSAEVDLVALRLPDDGQEALRLIAVAGPAAGELRPAPLMPYGRGTAGRAFQRGEPIVVNDYASDPLADASLREQGVAAVMALPIIIEGQPVAVISLISKELNHFSKERVALCERVAWDLEGLLYSRPLAVALTRELEAGRQRLEAFRAAAARLILEEDQNRALQHLVDTARELVGARYGALALWDSEGGLPHYVISGLSPEKQKQIGSPPRGLGVLGVVRDRGRSLRLADVSSSPNFRGFPSRHPRMKSFLGAPIFPRGGRGGAFYLADKEGALAFSEDDERLLNLFAILAGVMLDNLDLYGTAVRERKTLAAILESMTEGLLVADPQGRVVYFSQAAAAHTGIPIEKVVGRSVEEFQRALEPMLEPPEVVALLRDIFAGRVELPVTFDATLTSPQRQEFQVTALAIPLEGGERMMSFLAREVTLERDMERRRDTFVSIASHELRTPMTTILGFAELLLKKGVQEERQRQWLQAIYESSERLTSIVDDLLNVSRIQSEKISLRSEACPLPEVVERALAYIRPTTDRHEFIVDIPADTPHAWADLEKLGQVLTNLLSNAVKYSPGGGRIGVAAWHDPERGLVVVRVSDEGIGISPEDQVSLFTSFHRIRRPETARIRGTGLGLYIVKSLVDLMKGEVWVESEVGKGSTFFFTMPTRSDVPKELSESLPATRRQP